MHQDRLFHQGERLDVVRGLRWILCWRSDADGPGYFIFVTISISIRFQIEVVLLTDSLGLRGFAASRNKADARPLPDYRETAGPPAVMTSRGLTSYRKPRLHR